MFERKVKKSRFRRCLKWVVRVVAISFIALVLTRLIAGYVMQKRFNAKLEALRAAGEALTLAELAPPEIPATENAAVFYDQAFQQMELLPEKTRQHLYDLAKKREALTTEELDEARGLVNEAAEAIRLLRRGGERVKCRYTLDYGVRAGRVLLRHLPKILAGVRLLSLSSQVNQVEGKPDAAVADCAEMLKLARSVYAEPIMISRTVEITTTRSALKRLAAVMDQSEPSAAAVQQVLTALGDVEDRSEFVQEMRGCRCEGLDGVKDALENPASLQPWNGGHSYIPAYKGRLFAFVFRPLLLDDALGYLDMMDKFVELAGTSRWKSASDWDRANSEVEKIQRETFWTRPVSRLFLPNLFRVAVVFDQSVARKGCAKIAVALTLYRISNHTYPEKLAQLVPDFLEKLPTDPFSGKDLIYRRAGNGFIVYSVGVNQTDDGGTEDPKDRYAGDIVWKCSR